MPVVLTQNEVTESGHDYGDVLGVSYEYPTTYAGIVRAGERFVYYRGRRRRGGGTGPQAYLGVGAIGSIRPSQSDERLLVCSVEDYRPFVEPVPFRDSDGYLERAANEHSHPGLFFRRGVRAVPGADYDRILQLGFGGLEGPVTRAEDAPSAAYASPETARLVDEIAMSLAESEARRRFPEADVRRMPHNNPGFDIHVVSRDRERFLEVKGTTRADPHFFLSEGERRFSILHAADYALWVFYAIDLGERRGQLAERNGAISIAQHRLTPRQWAGVIPARTI